VCSLSAVVIFQLILNMVGKETQGVEGSSDSDVCKSNALPSAEESTLPEDLLENSIELIKLHGERQQELQQTIRHLEKSTNDFLYKFEKAIKIDRMAAITLLVGNLINILMIYRCGRSILTWEIAFHIIALGFGIVGFKRFRAAQKYITQEIEKGLAIFNTTAGQVISLLNNIVNNVEKILQHQHDEQRSSLAKPGDALSELAEMFKPEELQGLLKHGRRALEGAQNIDPHFTAVRCMLKAGIILGIKNYKIHGDFRRLKNQETVQEKEVGSKVGRFIWKTRELITHLRNSFHEITSSKTEVEMDDSWSAEMTDESVCGGIVVSTKMNGGDEIKGLVSLHLHYYRTICRNCVRIFKLHGMDYHRTPLGTSTAPYRDVLHDTPTLLVHLVDGQSETVAHLLLNSTVLVILYSIISGHRMLPTGRCPEDTAHRTLLAR
ncbi:hypothetical protein NFI96_004437, partial [Prochilodus magdalenae]